MTATNGTSTTSTSGTAAASKGARTRRAVLRAAADVVATDGLAAASQEQVAARAGISQSTLRHHFPTKDDLVRALFDDVHDHHRQLIERTLLEPGLADRERLLKIANTHLDVVTSSSDALAFEAYARVARDEPARRLRNEWYEWLVQHYVDLIGRLHPEFTESDRRGRATGVLSVLLGSWVVAGTSRPDLGAGSIEQLRNQLLASINAIIDAPPT